MDELSIVAPTRAMEVKGHRIVRRFTLDSRALGIRRAGMKDLAGGTPEENADAIRRLLEGERGAFRDVVVYNAGFVCWLAGKSRTPKLGVELAARALDSGAALGKLRQLQEGLR
jgi:anthranilate phosphoribosyltransferase